MLRNVDPSALECDLLAALPGDIESEKAYSDQLQAGLK